MVKWYLITKINENLGSISFISDNLGLNGESSSYTFGFENKSKEIIVFNNIIKGAYMKKIIILKIFHFLFGFQ